MSNEPSVPAATPAPTPAAHKSKKSEMTGWIATHPKTVWVSVGLVALLVIGMLAIQNKPTQVALTAQDNDALTAKIVSIMDSRLTTKTNVIVPAAADPDAVAVKDSGPACDATFTWDAASGMCVREGRPSLEQKAASFQAVQCVPGTTHHVIREIVVNGRPVKRDVVQTCGRKTAMN